ncbi:MAG: ARMT1-like domain-containing protein [bacterium]
MSGGMKASLDCIPCFIRQSLDAARMVSGDPAVHERILREVLGWSRDIELSDPPPVLGQRIHKFLRETSGADDPYRAVKDRLNRMAMSLLPGLRDDVESSPDPLAMAVRLAIAGNVIDMGARDSVTEEDVRRSIDDALAGTLAGDYDRFRRSAAESRSILYLGDNAGEIVFDHLLVEQLPRGRVTFVVRGSPVINDATLADARATGLDEIVKVIDNGSDAPGTLLEHCSPEFRCCFDDADMIIAKGQGNFESLSEVPRNIFFLFKVKCPVIGGRVGLPVGTNVLLAQSDIRLRNDGASREIS